MLVRDMFEKSGHDPSCNFAADVVAYLYDEIGETEKSRFESHLDVCGTCSADVAAFGSVRSSVADWRVAEFDALTTPAIEIPFDEKPAPAAAWSGTILTGFKKLFAFSPWPPAAVGFASLVVFVGIGFLAFQYFKTPNELADNRKQNNPIASPSVEKTTKPEDVAVNNTNSTSPGDDKDKTAVRPAPQPEGTVIKASATQNVPKTRGVKTTPDDVTPQKAVNKTEPQKIQKAPKLNNYTEEEDNTLRLADLFEEIDTKE